ncbi:hypothetical protein [Lysinibacillus odysseyi]|uniref:hypothetical protein n=1 Tax=Lysinibacillus odysseyi TaxID=202611 RepID=UPI000A44ED67|nr:hypothetical protein [Lysinibacillus odysseyi]
MSTPNRKVVKGRNEKELRKYVKDHERRGWRRVGKTCELHGIYKSEYMQVMEYGRMVQ